MLPIHRVLRGLNEHHFSWVSLGAIQSGARCCDSGLPIYSAMSLAQYDATDVRRAMCLDLFRSRHVADLAAALLRDRGTATVNGREVSGEVILEQIQIVIKRPHGPYFQVIFSCSDADCARSVVNVVYDAYVGMIKEERGRLEELFLQRMREKEAAAPEVLGDFLAGWQSRRADYLYVVKLHPTDEPCGVYRSNIHVVAEYPYSERTPNTGRAGR